ncbi:transglutaminase domain-containing protein, partial [candidate division KSB1 bacterium]|nr:transglutaminase domain-containing protein [candidate division KSB1 bacterium]
VSEYVLENRHADCGMQTIFFMTLCRMNGIPTRWQSGWVTEPGESGMHDWGEIYFEPYGWVPVDVTYGLRKSGDDTIKWFYIGAMDSYRLIVNDDYSHHFYPEKIHHRSETIDFQRGEVEWKGGNLYFDQWDYDFDVEVIE